MHDYPGMGALGKRHHQRLPCRSSLTGLQHFCFKYGWWNWGCAREVGVQTRPSSVGGRASYACAATAVAVFFTNAIEFAPVAKRKQRRLVLAQPPRVAFPHGAFPHVVSPAEAQAPDPLVESSLDPLTLGADPLIGN